MPELQPFTFDHMSLAHPVYKNCLRKLCFFYFINTPKNVNYLSNLGELQGFNYYETCSYSVTNLLSSPTQWSGPAK